MKNIWELEHVENDENKSWDLSYFYLFFRRAHVFLEKKHPPGCSNMLTFCYSNIACWKFQQFGSIFTAIFTSIIDFPACQVLFNPLG